jgi:hypothetical protein
VRAAAGTSAVDQLEALGVGGILWQLAKAGQIIDVRCEMPQCYCHRGRRHFDPRPAPSPCPSPSPWSPTADHYPRLKKHGGHLTPDNVRLGHKLCNQLDYTWRTQINAMLGKKMSLDAIAVHLNAKKVPTIHGTNRWTASSVRKAFVS